MCSPYTTAPSSRTCTPKCSICVANSMRERRKERDGGKQREKERIRRRKRKRERHRQRDIENGCERKRERKKSTKRKRQRAKERERERECLRLWAYLVYPIFLRIVHLRLEVQITRLLEVKNLYRRHPSLR